MRIKCFPNNDLAFLSVLIYAIGCVGCGVESVFATETQATVRLDSLGDPLPPNALLRLGTTRFRHPSTVVDLALSTDEKTVVTIGSDELIVWDAETGKELWRAETRPHNIDLPAASYGIRALAFGSDSTIFYTPGGRNEIIAWKTETGQNEIVSIESLLPPHLFKLLLGPSSSRSIDVTADSKKFAVGSAHGVVVCDEKGKVLYKIVNAPAEQVEIDKMNQDRLLFGGHYSYARFSPNEETLAVVVSETPEEIRLIEAETGDELRRIALTARLVRLAFSPDSKRLVTTERDSAVRSYSIDSGEKIWSYEIELHNKAESYTSDVAVSPNGKTIAACAPIGSDYLIHLLDAATGDLIGKLEGHTWKPWAAAFTADSKTLYSSGWDGAIRRWDVESRTQLPLPQGVRATGVCAASPDGKSLAYADDFGTIHLVHSEDAVEICTIAIPGAGYSQLAFSADSQQLAGGGTCEDQVHVAVWSLADGDLRSRWDWPKGSDPHSKVEALEFSSDGKRLAAAVFRQDAVYLWDMTTFDEVAQLPHSRVYGLSFSPDSKTLATVGWDSLIQLWDAEIGESNDVVYVEGVDNEESDTRIWEASYSPEGDLLATAHLDQSVRVWQVDGMQLRSQFKMKGIFRHGVLSFSPDGLWIAAGTSRGCASLWEPISGELVWDTGCHKAAIYTVGFGHNSRALVSGASDGTCYLWDTRPIGELPENDPEQLWNDLAADGSPAYQSMWALAEMPDRAVELLAAKLRPIEQLIDLEYVPVDLEPKEVEHQRLLNEIAIGKDDSIERTVTVRRALSTLSQIGTPASKELLNELADRDSDTELGRLATVALERSQRIE